MPKSELTASDIMAMIAKRHEKAQGWWVVEEVPNTSGSHRSRRCDALAIQTFPSRGIQMVGYEVKVSRADVIAELRQPKKAEAFQRFCTRWWLAIPSADLIEGLEIPSTWGVMVVDRGKLKAHRDAPELAPEPWTPGFCAAVLRTAVNDMVPKRLLEEIEAQIAERAEAQTHLLMETEPRRVEQLEKEAAAWRARYDELVQRTQKFQALTGVQIIAPAYARGHTIIGEVAALEVVRSLDRRISFMRDLRGARGSLQRLLDELTQAESTLQACRTSYDEQEFTDGGGI